MGKHRLGRKEMIRGVEAALRSRKTPSHLKHTLRRRLRELKQSPTSGLSKGRKDNQRVGFLGWLQF